MNEIVTHDGEVIEQIAPNSLPLAIGLARAEIDIQVETARRYPRSIQRATGAILTLATMDEETAAECSFALPRGGKPILGPSIRLAEIIHQCWGNCRVSTRIVETRIEDKMIVAEASFLDLETGSGQTVQVSRRISDKYGKLYNEDMRIVTGNAAMAIAKRNVILGCVPKPVWRQAYEAARKVVAGDVQTLTVRREKAVTAFAAFGIKPEQVFAALGVAGNDDINLDHIPILRGMFSAIKNGEATVEEIFSGKPTSGAAHTVVKNALADEPAQEKDAAGGSSQSEAPADASKGVADPAGADPIFEDGATAARQGSSRKNVPLPVRKHEDQTARWLSGYDSVNGGK